MTLIASKRFQQGVFAVAASLNRAAGSGGGSGFVVAQLLATSTNSGAASAGVGGGGDKVLDTVSFSLSRTGNVLLASPVTGWVTCAIAHIASESLYFQVDGVNASSATPLAFQVFAPGSQQSNNATLIYVTMLSAGAHTVNLIINTPEGANDLVTWIDYLVAIGMGA